MEDAWLLFADAVLAHGAVGHGAGSQVSTAELEAALGAARSTFHESLDSEVPFAALAANAELQRIDAEVLAVAAAIESSQSRLSLLAFTGPDGSRQRLTIDAVHLLFDQEHLLALSPDGPLLTSALVELIDAGTWSEQIVAVHHTVLWALAGSYASDPNVPVDATIAATDRHEGHQLVVVAGADRMRRRQAATLHTRGTRFLVTPLPASSVEWAAVVREATLIGCGVIVEVEDALPDLARRWITRAAHLAWAISAPHDIPVAELPQRPWVEIDAGDPATTGDEQSSVLGADASGAHKLTFDQLHTVARVLPCWEQCIAPQLRAGRNVMIVAHGNSLRALVKMLDRLSESAIVELNIPTGIPLLYELDEELAARSSRYLGDAEAVQAAAEAVRAQTEQR
jgi:hypothetical protein